MEEPYEKDAIRAPGPASLPKATVEHAQHEAVVDSRPATTSTLTTHIVVDPVSNSLELESRSHRPSRNAPTPEIAVEVPRSKRRGLFACATMLAEIKDPYQYSYKTKWFIVFIVAYARAAAPMGSAIFFRRS